jgi:PadR family transcriptional regulator, regulatory protein PadR
VSPVDKHPLSYLVFLGMKAEKLKGHLDLLLLSVLSRGPGHGYEVITRLRDRSDGAFELPEGTVYPALHRLETAGLLASTWEVVAGRRRRIYHVTLAGERALAEQARQWGEFSGSMARVLGALVARAHGAVPPCVSPAAVTALGGTA